MRCSSIRSFVVLAMLVISATARGQTEHRYSFLELPALGGNHSFGSALNQSGNVVGSAFVPGNDFHAAIWIDGEPRDLGTLGGSDSEALGVNSTGRVVGWAVPPGGGLFDERAVLWRDSQIIDLGTLGGDVARAHAINELDEIVGQSYLVGSSGRIRAFVWRDGEMENLGGFEPEGSSFAYGINNLGQIVGRAWKSSERATLWQDSEIIDLGTHRSDNAGRSQARDINDFGYIVGWADDETSRSKAFIWLEGRMYNIHTLGLYSQSGAYAINSVGQVVGVHSTDEGLARGFLWEQGHGMQLLTDLVPPKCRWRPMVAFDINNAGQMAGYGTPKAAPDSIYRAFIMSPVYPTLEMAPPAPGRAGEANTLTVSNCTPGATVQFLYSRFGGGTRIPGCDLQQNALQLDSPTVIGAAIADQSGVATITRTVPPVARGQTILFQAVVQNECAISQLVVHRFD